MKPQDYPLYEVKKVSEYPVSYNEAVRCDYVSKSGFLYQTFLQKKKGSDILVVLLHGAKDQGQTSPPYFDRWSWVSSVFNCNLLNISDPTLQVDKKMKLAWYLGSSDEYVTLRIVEIVDSISNALNIPKEKVVFWGSSGGGFAAMQASLLLDGSVSVAINPQTSVLNYYKGHVDTAIKNCFSDDVSGHKEKLSIFDRMRSVVSSRSSVYVFQNVNDRFHYENHFTPFKEFSGGFFNRRLCFEEYESEKPHGPEDKQQASSFFKSVMG